MDPVVMMLAKEHKIFEISESATFPMHHVMHVGEGDIRAPGKATMAIAAHHFSALGVAR